MGRITDAERARNEQAIRAAMDRLLSGRLAPGQRLDLKTLAREAGVSRTGFYPRKNPDGSHRPGPYQHLAAEFTRRLAAQQEAGTTADPRQAQVERLKDRVAALEERLQQRDHVVRELTEFKERALSQLAAQHAEIEQLRRQAAGPLTVVRPLPDPRERRPVR